MILPVGTDDDHDDDDTAADASERSAAAVGRMGRLAIYSTPLTAAVAAQPLR